MNRPPEEPRSGDVLRDTQRPGVALVTGATGFAGRHLVDLLLRETVWRIVGTCRRGAPGASDRCHYQPVDLREPAALAKVLRETRPDFVFHLAAATPGSEGSYLEVNVGGTAALMEAVAGEAPDARILNVGSDAQYGSGATSGVPTSEETPMRPIGTYGRSKVVQEAIALGYADMSDLNVVCVRAFNYIGPGQSDRFVVGTLAHQIARAELEADPAAVDVGDTAAQRDFTDVRDVVRALLASLLLGQPGRVYNIGSGTPRAVHEILEILASLAARPFAVHPVAARLRTHSVPVTICDASRMSTETGWSATTPLEQTLRDTLDYWRDAAAAESGISRSAGPVAGNR